MGVSRVASLLRRHLPLLLLPEQRRVATARPLCLAPPSVEEAWREVADEKVPSSGEVRVRGLVLFGVWGEG